MSTIQYHAENTIPSGDWIWVFGSNLKGVHGKGAAKVARVNFRAEYGVGKGPTGQAYAIPTMDAKMVPLGLSAIVESVDAFLGYAADNPKLNFFVTRIGASTGYADEVIAPLFINVPGNCSLPGGWLRHRLGRSVDAGTLA